MFFNRSLRADNMYWGLTTAVLEGLHQKEPLNTHCWPPFPTPPGHRKVKGSLPLLGTPVTFLNRFQDTAIVPDGAVKPQPPPPSPTPRRARCCLTLEGR